MIGKLSIYAIVIFAIFGTLTNNIIIWSLFVISWIVLLINTIKKIIKLRRQRKC